MNNSIHTVESVRALLSRNPICPKTRRTAVEAAIVAIYNRQTEGEKVTGMTVESNGIGFAAGDDKIGSYMARWILSGKRLTGRFERRAAVMAHKYARQLAEKANRKATYQATRKILVNLGQSVPDASHRIL